MEEEEDEEEDMIPRKQQTWKKRYELIREKQRDCNEIVRVEEETHRVNRSENWVRVRVSST